MKQRVYYRHTDAGGIVYHTSYIDFCEFARSEFFFQNNINFNNDDGYFVVKNLNADFIASAKLGDMLDIKTYILKIKKASITLHQEIFIISDVSGNKINQKIFQLQVTCVFLKQSKISPINSATLNIINRLI